MHGLIQGWIVRATYGIELSQCCVLCSSCVSGFIQLLPQVVTANQHNTKGIYTTRYNISENEKHVYILKFSISKTIYCNFDHKTKPNNVRWYLHLCFKNSLIVKICLSLAIHLSLVSLLNCWTLLLATDRSLLQIINL